jgi:cytochrome c oxidase assembly factor CtaG
VAWAVAVLALWLWHLSDLFDAALRSNPIHALEHACFVLTSTLFWWALVRAHGRRRTGRGAAALYVVAMALQSALLGALLTFSRSPWYYSNGAVVRAWGVTPVQDQQIAGLIMWVPAGAVYFAAAAILFAFWLSEGEGATEDALLKPILGAATRSPPP